MKNYLYHIALAAIRAFIVAVFIYSWLAVPDARAQSLGAAAPVTFGVVQVVAGGFHSCLLTNRGAVKCWGFNAYGQLGDNTNINRYMPVEVFGLQSGVVAIAAGHLHTCAIVATPLDEREVRCWGYGPALGNGSTADKLVPTKVLNLTNYQTAIAAGGNSSCAIELGGVLKCWGANTYGQLGDATFASKLQAVRVVNLVEARAVAVGFEHTCASDEGRLMCWGRNHQGQLGVLASGTEQPIAIGVANFPGTVAAIALGAHSCATNTAGTVKCWGANTAGQVGDGSTTNRSTPVNVVDLASDVSGISAGVGYSLNGFACAIVGASRGVKCWGNNVGGELGMGPFGPQLRPVNVSNLASGVRTLSSGYAHTCALLDGGGVKCWGRNTEGELGNNELQVNFPYPVQVFAREKSNDDLSGDGKRYLVATDSNGEISVTTLDGITPLSQTPIIGPNSGWSVTHRGDVTRDNTAELFIRNADGRISILQMNGAAVANYASFLPAGNGYALTHLADFNGDGFTDVLLVRGDGTSVIVLGGAGIGTVLNAGPWRVIQTGDFNGDGRDDILIREPGGAVGVILLNGYQYVDYAPVLNAGSGWEVTHVADFDGDGKSDLVIRKADGTTAILLMDGKAAKSAAFLLNAGTPYEVTHIGDFNHDGKADILLSHVDRSAAILLMDGTRVAQSGLLLMPGSTSKVAKIIDFDLDGKSDIVLRNDDGSATAVVMNGLTVTRSGALWGPGSLRVMP
jgi:alpha-tubulin suppressor-like RCC1 family protein